MKTIDLRTSQAHFAYQSRVCKYCHRILETEREQQETDIYVC